MILSQGSLMQFWKALNYFPIFMIDYTYKTWTSLLEETDLRAKAVGGDTDGGQEGTRDSAGRYRLQNRDSHASAM